MSRDIKDIFLKAPLKEQKKVPLLGVPYGETNIGLKRDKNEDAILLFSQSLYPGVHHDVFAVADGVGGQPYGEVASQSIVSSIYQYAEAGKYINQDTLKKINRSIESGATTLVLAQQSNKDPNHYHLYSIGDSSAYILDVNKKTFTEITRRDENTQGLLTQAMGPDTGSSKFRRANESFAYLQFGQTLLLATDGFTQYLDKHHITNSQVLKRRQYYPKNSDFVQSLINLSNVKGGHDNITIISIPYQKTP